VRTHSCTHTTLLFPPGAGRGSAGHAQHGMVHPQGVGMRPHPATAAAAAAHRQQVNGGWGWAAECQLQAGVFACTCTCICLSTLQCARVHTHTPLTFTITHERTHMSPHRWDAAAGARLARGRACARNGRSKGWDERGRCRTTGKATR